MNRPTLRVVHLSTTEKSGGAALAANRVHLGLVAEGADSSMFVTKAQTGDPKVREFSVLPGAPAWLNRTLFRAGRRIKHSIKTDGTLFTPDRTAFGRLPLRQLPRVDIYHLHWVTDLFDFRLLPLMARRAPVVWTLHDMNAFTGGCHYDGGCGRFEQACGACPALVSDVPKDESYRVLRRKRKILSALPPGALTIVAPSRWLAQESSRSAAFGRFKTHVIPYGLDTHLFAPADRPAARARLGLAPEERALLFVAENFNDPRKGVIGLQPILAQIEELPRVRILTLGAGAEQHFNHPAYRHLGRLVEPAAIRDAYAAADVFVIPSLQDNFPNTVLESLACGTPVVGFAVGGVTDAVEHGVSGLLAEAGDAAQLSSCLVELLFDDARREPMRAAARQRAVTLYSLRRQARDYLDLYGQLLAERTRLTNPLDTVVSGKPSI